MAKRKREAPESAAAAKALKSRKDDVASTPKQPAPQDIAIRKRREPAVTRKAAAEKATQVNGDAANGDSPPDTISIQVVTGSYERVLHGFAASIPGSLLAAEHASTSEAERPKVDFTDTFLFNAHASAIRCMAISPLSDETSKVTLATGSTDERINLYSISTAPPPASSKLQPKLPSLSGGSITENPKNKELGSLLHHSSNITALYFPTRSKLLSSAEDSTIAIVRTCDWTALSTIKAPIPKPQGRPSGDTAGPGEVPSGINDFAVHPSMKLMLSVGKGEKCMRLWNLVTGKKAGVLNFDRSILAAVGEGRFSSGEARRVIWDPEGEEFALGFDRALVVFTIDSKPKAKIAPFPRSKIHQMAYLPETLQQPNILLVSTEDGRVLVYDTSATDASSSTDQQQQHNAFAKSKQQDTTIPPAKLIAQIGGPAAGITSRIKDFELVPLSPHSCMLVTASSDGTVRLWALHTSELDTSNQQQQQQQQQKDSVPAAATTAAKGFSAPSIGSLLASYSTGTRITCLKAFPLTGDPDDADDDAVLLQRRKQEAESSSDDDDDDDDDEK